jgi:prephenate dehydrogenase
MRLSNTVVGIAGLGLIGGSLAAAIKKYLPAAEVIGYDRNFTEAERALENKLINNIENTFDKLVNLSELLILASPISSALEHIKLLHSYARKMIVTDVCSVKRPLIKAAKTLSGNITFVGGHPMTGSQKTGNENADPDLFRNAPYVLCPVVTSQIPNALMEIIRAIGALPLILPADIHDKAVSQISHIPQMVAVALLNESMKESGDYDAPYKLSAGGFRDVTRIGESSYSVWKDILKTNKDNIIADLGTMIIRLNEYKESLRKGDLALIEKEFHLANSIRKKMDKT